jgi:predicted amidohydrolase
VPDDDDHTETATPVRVAAIQMRGTRDVDRNIAGASALIREAAARGARYVQTPEITNIVELRRSRLLEAIRPPESDPALAAFRTLALELGIHLHLGSLAEAKGDKAVNRGFLIGPDGAVIASYDKLHMFDVDLPNGESWRESALFAAGSRAVVADTGLFRLGLGICYDIRFPELYAALAKAGAEVLTAPSCFTRQTGEAHWHVLTRARAIETGSFLIAATQGGTHEDGRQSFGHSIIVDPWGRVLAEGGEDPCVLLADLDLGEVAAARRRIPALAHRRPFTVEHVASPAGLRRAS